MAENVSSRCPTSEQIEQLVAGELEDEDVRQHVQECPVCRETAARLRENNELLREFAEAEVGLDGDSIAADPGVPGYELVSEIHRGGQGVIFKAIHQATKRKVALKMLAAGTAASPRQQRRFDREIELVAMLRHPNIVTLYDSAATEDGRHYFAMEYIRGLKLDQYSRPPCRPSVRPDTSRSIEEILRLFMKVCAAVQYAHQRGVIHRDLKPGNILVDAEGEPHVLDFGLAKALGQNLIGSGLAATQTGEFMGTLAYAAPEQVKGDPEQIDTRADVYSLGVILYEMLTGTLPYSVSGSLSDVIRNITEVEPATPSTCRAQIDDELDIIVLKSLAKERERRYQSVESLRNDLERYLAGQPIDARRDSAWYVLRKAVARYRVPVAVATAFVLVVLASTVALSVALARSAEARDQARTEAAKMSAIVTFLNDDLLAAANPDQSTNRELTMREVLDAASDRIEGRFEGEPLVQASIQATLGRTYKSLGEYGKAGAHLQEALRIRRETLGPEHAETLSSMSDLASLYAEQGRYEESEKLHTKTLELRRRILGAEHPSTLSSMNHLALLYKRRGWYDRAETLYEQTLEIRRRVLGEENRDTLISMNNLASLYYDRGRFDEAEKLHLKALDCQRRVLGEEHMDTLCSMNNLTRLYFSRGQQDKVEPLLVKILEIRSRVLGEEHPHTLTSMGNLGSFYSDQGRHEEAEPLLERSLEIRRRILGEKHPSTLTSMNYLASLYRRRGRYDEARALYEQTVEARRRVLGEEHQYTLISMNNLGFFHNALGQYAEAEPVLATAVDRAKRSLPDKHWLKGTLLRQYGVCLIGLERFEDAEAVLHEAYRISLATSGPSGMGTLKAVDSLVRLYEAWDKPERAAEFRALLPRDDPPKEAEAAPSTKGPSSP